MIRISVFALALCASTAAFAFDPWQEYLGRQPRSPEDLQRDQAIQSQARDASSALLKQDLQTMTQSNDSFGVQRQLEGLEYNSPSRY